MDEQASPAVTSPGPAPLPAAYEPPRVERVLTAADLEAEVLYAGAPASPR